MLVVRPTETTNLRNAGTIIIRSAVAFFHCLKNLPAVRTAVYYCMLFLAPDECTVLKLQLVIKLK